ncbi:MAG: hypothetical protein ACRDH9_08005 [Actinomycetota bacterium]
MKARTVALTLGVSFGALTVLELVFGDWAIGSIRLLERSTKANLLHWALALVLLGSFFANQRAVSLACRIVGPILLVLGIWGLLSARSLGDVLGHTDGIPVTYSLLSLLTGVGATVTGYGKRPKAA